MAALTGFVIAGLFEYNFGDSEVLLLLLFIVSIPFGIQRANEAESVTPEIPHEGVPELHCP